MNGGWSFDIGIATLSVIDANGYLGIQTDVEGSEASGNSSNAGATPTAPTGGAPDYEAIMPGGILHRPLDPTIDQNGNPNGALSAQVLNFREAGRVWAMPLSDPRVVAMLPPYEKGDTLIYSAAGSFVRLVGSGAHVGRITQYTTTDGTTAGGMVYAGTWPDRFVRVAPWGKEQLDANGYELVAGGCRIDMMSIGGIPGAAGMGATIGLTSPGNIALDAPSVQLGADGPTGHGPVVRADLLLAQVILPIVKAISDLQTAVLALAASPAVVGAPPAGAAASIPIVSADVATIAPLASPTLTPLQTWASATTTVN